MNSHEDIIWKNINNGFCRYKTKTASQDFCRHPMNITGLCARRACPLANARYCTVIEKEGKLYLAIKTPERAHLPEKLFEYIELPKKYEEAIKVINEKLMFWPKWNVRTARARALKLGQMLSRMRKLRSATQDKLVPIKKKVERREVKRQAKALAAAQIEASIEKELLNRLKTGHYEDIYNIHEAAFEKTIGALEIEAPPKISFITEEELEMEIGSADAVAEAEEDLDW